MYIYIGEILKIWKQFKLLLVNKVTVYKVIMNLYLWEDTASVYIVDKFQRF